jgi:DHA1 family multidrug resistance protein-like MFS transporter
VASSATRQDDAGWRQTVYIVALALFAASFGFTFISPFLALYLNRDLGVHDLHQLALWTGLAASGTGLTMTFASPLWGAVADRFGRKAMLVRALGAGGAFTVAMGLCQNALELTAVRCGMGLVAGGAVAANALVASVTPAARVGWALGLASSGRALGQSFGPLVGGVLASFLSIRAVFVAAGLFIAIAAILVMLWARESGPRRAAGARIRLLAALRASGATSTVMVVVGAMAATQLTYAGAQQLLVLKLIALGTPELTIATGFTFTVVGLASGVGAVTYSRLLGIAGYKRVAMLAAALLGLAVAVAAVAPALPELALAGVGMGLAYGAVSPALGSMLGLESPPEARATAFGASGSALAVGNATGPLAGGLVASLTNVPLALLVLACGAVLAVLLLGFGSREPL